MVDMINPLKTHNDSSNMLFISNMLVSYYWTHKVEDELVDYELEEWDFQ